MPVLLAAILGSIVFTTLGVMLLLYTEASPLMAWLCIGFFGLGGIAIVIKQLYLGAIGQDTVLSRPKRRDLSNNTGRQTSGVSMGADAFVAFYGIKIPLDPDDEATLDACGAEKDPRCIAAKRVGLQSHTGRMTDGEDYFLYLGIRLGWLGLEHNQYANVPQERLTAAMASVQAKLLEAGFSEQPSLHLQFVGQY